ncbi:probable serine/threonine-protein kinase WNK5 isoform X1 [Malania oleifera]|uniref:probable serine/threonine-protein kinase WNK5 isoform X1 n=1 Tax=Malania oleifera TaxID=397392 RepID=UPI0025ADC174|nr:probable serine/threonine-protein kinase WNK5 isoform X1 [Malania oleifera]
MHKRPMQKSRLGEAINGVGEAQVLSGYIETDPSGRYGRFRETLGKGAMKTVYKGFDMAMGMEVAWNQVKLHDVLKSPGELQRLYSEVHLLKTLNHDSIMRYYASWIDVHGSTFNFITEMFTSGTLRQYRQKHKHLEIGAVKKWVRQILHGLAYLHGHDPPVIHRDLKCDNIFVNGHLGQVKIGDLGLATILGASRQAHSVIGTPEFMAPEMYEEKYSELVDIYSLGMCVLEMLTLDYPYSECSNPAQIYKRVTSGRLPEAFYKIQDLEARTFVGKCLENASKRLPAQMLLLDSFLASHEGEPLLIPRAPTQKGPLNETKDEMPLLFLADPQRTTNMTITGSMDPKDDTLFLKVQFFDKDGNARNIYFPFDTRNDTAIDVAMEMVKELEINDWDPLEIAMMIEKEISSLVPSWKELGSFVTHHADFLSYEENCDESLYPFCSFSSCSSSHASLLGFSTSYETRVHPTCNATFSHDWLQVLFNDDASSQGSLNSHKCYNLNYYSGNDDDLELSLGKGDHIFIENTHKSTRVSTVKGMRVDNYKTYQQRKMTKIKSLIDVRSQLLHQSLVEEINKRRLFKTIGALENIGFQEPSEFSSRLLLGNGSSSRSLDEGEKARFEC